MTACPSARIRRRLRALGALGCFALLAVAGPAIADDSADELGRRHFESGEAYFKVSDYDNALREFTQAYELSKRPEVLISIATVHERMAHLREAVAALEQYLAAVPEGKDADTMRIRVENLKKRLESAPSPAAAPPGPAPAPSTTPPPVAQPTARAASSAAPAPPPAPGEDYGPNVPALLALGVGVLATGGAVATGILAQSEYNDAKKTCSPACTDHQLAPGRSLAWTSTALTGVAIVGVGVGVTLLLTGHKKTEAPPNARLPTLFVGLGPRGAGAAASFTF
jgi:tetratricopeptide (TPR) repeat protein